MKNQVTKEQPDIKQIADVMKKWLPEETVQKIISEEGRKRLARTHNTNDLLEAFKDLKIEELSGIVKLNDPYIRQAKRIVDEMYDGHMPRPSRVKTALTDPTRLESPGAPSDGDDADDTAQGTVLGAVVGAVGAAVGVSAGVVTAPVTAAVVVAVGALAGAVGGSYHD